MYGAPLVCTVTSRPGDRIATEGVKGTASVLKDPIGSSKPVQILAWTVPSRKKHLKGGP